MKVLVLSPANNVVKNVVRDLMYGCWCGGKRIGGMQMPPLNLLYVATVLKENGHYVKFVDAGIDYDLFVNAKRNATDYGAVVVLSSTNSFKVDIKQLEELKRFNPDIITIIFGSHSTFMPEYCLNSDCVDIIIRGEPEFIIRDVINSLSNNKDWKNIKGIGFKDGGKVVLNEFYPLIEDLDELPVPDRSYLPNNVDYFNPVVKRMPYTTMQTSRGCPAKCNFCTVPDFFGKKIRVRSVKKVIDEMMMLRSAGYKEIFIRDETFTAYKDRNKEICRLLISNKVDITWICNARVDMIDKESVVLLKNAGCHMIKFGVESGSQDILNNIKKGITLEQTRRAFKICHEVGIDTHAHVMLGSPGETKETIKNTINFIKEIDPSTVSFGIHTPYPGTELFNKVAIDHPGIKDGSAASMEKLHISGFFNESFTDLGKLELEKSVRRSYRKFYFRPKYLFERLMSINDFDELMRLIVAGSNIFSFGVNKK